ncbi:MAG: C40 family peptidase [Thiopseudomonas sp.]|nr:C40 family peptidase [Thiopseudomonas sp.]
MHWSGRVTVISILLLSAACATHQGPSKQTASIDKVKAQHAKPVKTTQPTVITRTQMADDVLLRAMAQIGTPYRWGGSSPQTGFDCSGLIGYVFSQSAGYQMPRTTTEMMQVVAPQIERNRLRSGDIVFFATNGGRRVSHAGIYVGDNRFVHAPASGGKVRIDSLDMPYWNKAYLQAKRYLPEERLASSF